MVRLMDIAWDAEALFVARPNRFLATVRMLGTGGGSLQQVHVRDPGRLEELLFPGNRLALSAANTPGRKTAWDLVAAESEAGWVLVNSGLHRAIAESILKAPMLSPFGDVRRIRAEVKRGRSRLDFLITTVEDDDVWIEVKGCTLVRNGTALFPDAPTSRGTKHLRELIDIRERGQRAAVMILVLRPDADRFTPNRETDELFSDTMDLAINKGVEVYPLKFALRDDGSLNYLAMIPNYRSYM